MIILSKNWPVLCLAFACESALIVIEMGGTCHMNARRFCNGVTRRDFIHLGAASAFGLGLNLPTILQAQERAAARGRETRDVSLIFLNLHGGLSTIDTFDM